MGSVDEPTPPRATKPVEDGAESPTDEENDTESDEEGGERTKSKGSKGVNKTTKRVKTSRQQKDDVSSSEEEGLFL